MDAPPIIVRHRFGYFLPLASLGAVVIGGVAALILFAFDPAKHSFYPRCYMYVTTGLVCPGCGSLRAMHQMLHGHLLTALRYNALLVLASPVVGWFAVRMIWARYAGRPQPSFSLPSFWVKLLIGVFVVFSLVRNIPVPPFTYLAPP